VLDAPTTAQSCCFLDRACLIFSPRGRAGQELPWHVRTDFEQKETKVTKGGSRALGCANAGFGGEGRSAVAHCRLSLRERMLLSAYVVSVRSFAERKATMKGSPWDAR
jgi:hypothetical protein